MRLFWKLFLVLAITLLITASLSTWIARQWMQGDQAIENRLNSLASHADTAISLLDQNGLRAYRRWLMHTMRAQHFRGMLVDRAGRNILGRKVPARMRPLVDQVLRRQSRITTVRPPNLAVALPAGAGNDQLYWIATSVIPPHLMRQTGRQLMMVRITFALLVILLISWLITRMLTRPVASLQAAAERLGQGKMDTRTAKKLSTRKDELGDLARSFDAMAAQIDSLVGSHKQLLRDVSHELRSPLARLQVALELARNEAGDSAQEELARIGKEAEQLNHLIGEVLTLASFEQGDMQPRQARLQLDQILEAIIHDAIFEAQAADKQISVDAMQACSVHGDPIWLHRAFDNIIRNAIRHTDVGTAVSASLTVSGGVAHIAIRDRGAGVAPEALPRLFEPFYRASEARERESGGYGLGLTIARRVIRSHGGTIDAANHPHGGLMITVSLPLIQERKPETDIDKF